MVVHLAIFLVGVVQKGGCWGEEWGGDVGTDKETKAVCWECLHGSRS